MPNRLSSDELIDWLTDKVAQALNVAPETIDIDFPLADYGLDSAASLEMSIDLEIERGVAVDRTVVWDFATIAAIAAYIADDEAAS